MKREFLQSIRIGEEGLPKEVIDAIMAENGKDIQAAKEMLFEGKSAKQWKESYDMAVESHKKELDTLHFQNLLDSAITQVKGKNAKAITALLDMETLRQSETPEQAINDALQGLKDECGYLFGDDRTPPPYARSTGAYVGANEEKPATLAGALREKFERK